MKTVESKENQLRSPELLNRKICVSNPGVWLLLGVMALLLVGICIWGIFGCVETTAHVDAAVENGVAVCSLDQRAAAALELGAPVRIGAVEGRVIRIEPDENGKTCRIFAEVDVPDGACAMEIVTERIRPISFVLN